MEWLRQLNNAIEYIESNLDSEISYDEAARIACCSTYYFQRIFTYVTGVSLAEYIRRRRMTQAAFELQQTDKRVLDIALKYGYTSPTSFNRAFQKVHGITPVAVKSMGSKLYAYLPIRFSVNVAGGNSIPYHIEEKGSIRIVGVRTQLVEDMETNLKEVPKFWENALNGQQFSKICRLSQGEPEGILGVSVFQNPDNIYYYIAASSNSPVPNGMYEYEIPAATWAVFENDGYFKESVQEVFRRFYTEWLLFSGYEYAGFPDMEVYPVVENGAIHGHSEVWIAIKNKED